MCTYALAEAPVDFMVDIRVGGKSSEETRNFSATDLTVCKILVTLEIIWFVLSVTLICQHSRVKKKQKKQKAKIISLYELFVQAGSL